MFFHCLLMKGMIVNTDKKDREKDIFIAIEGEDDTDLNINRLESAYSNESLKFLVRNQSTFAQKKNSIEKRKETLEKRKETLNEYALCRTEGDIINKAVGDFKSVYPSVFNYADTKCNLHQNMAVDIIAQQIPSQDSYDRDSIERKDMWRALSSDKNDITKHMKTFLDLERKLIDCMPIYIKKNNKIWEMDDLLNRYVKECAKGEVQQLKILSVNISMIMKNLCTHNVKLVEKIRSAITKINPKSIAYLTYLSIAKICLEKSDKLYNEVESFNVSVNRVCANLYSIIPSVKDSFGTNVPGVNKRFYFDFGYKSKQFVLDSLYQGKTKIAIVSCKNNLEYMFNIDRQLCEDKIPFVSSLVADKIDTGLEVLLNHLSLQHIKSFCKRGSNRRIGWG